MAGPYQRRASAGGGPLTVKVPDRQGSVPRGLALSGLGYALFAVQDATVKWLVADYPVPEILLIRSLVILIVAAAIGRGVPLAALARSPRKAALGLRAALILAAWLSYYTAASRLGLAELTTLYFAAPIVAVVLSVAILHEAVDGWRWGAVALGFAGVLLAADPHGGPAGPILLALFAACCWGLSVVLVRLISRSETTANQMLVSNGLFALACAAMVVPLWRPPDAAGLGLMLGLGVAGGLGQYLLYEGFRHAPASAVAPIEYTGLVWAFLYGFLIWGDVPGWRVFAGAGLIVGASLMLLAVERRRALNGAPDREGSRALR